MATDPITPQQRIASLEGALFQATVAFRMASAAIRELSPCVAAGHSSALADAIDSTVTLCLGVLEGRTVLSQASLETGIWGVGRTLRPNQSPEL